MTGKKIAKRIIGALVVLYLCICLSYYFFQKLFLFTHTKTLGQTYRFDAKLEERDIETNDGKILSGVLFRLAAHKD